jgi:hypothetical protein
VNTNVKQVDVMQEAESLAARLDADGAALVRQLVALLRSEAPAAWDVCNAQREACAARDALRLALSDISALTDGREFDHHYYCEKVDVDRSILDGVECDCMAREINQLLIRIAARANAALQAASGEEQS